MTEVCPDEFIAFGERLAETSRPILRRYFRTPFTVEDKADASPVTIADREAEAAMRAAIAATYPDHGIFGEEFPFVRTEAEFAWVLDPIDGTKAFVTGMPVFGTLIALLRADRPILGIIDQPMTAERWVGAEGRPTLLNGRPVRTRSDSTLETASHYATHPDMFFEGDDLAKFEAVAARAKLSRFGGDCYAYGMLAAGCIDLVTEACLQIYDFMALIPVIEGAGGIVTDWNGAPMTRESDGHILAAANGKCHAAALKLLCD